MSSHPFAQSICQRALDAMCPMLPLPPGLFRVPPRILVLHPALCSLLPGPWSLVPAPRGNSMGCPASTCHCLCPGKQTGDRRAPLNHSAWALQTFTLLRAKEMGGCGMGRGNRTGFRVQSSGLLRVRWRGRKYRVLFALPCLALLFAVSSHMTKLHLNLETNYFKTAKKI